MGRASSPLPPAQLRGMMGISSNQVEVTSSVTKVVHDDTDGCHAVVNNVGVKTVYLGDDTVTVNNGFVLKKSTDFCIDLGPGEEIFGICATDETTTVSYLLTKNDN